MKNALITALNNWLNEIHGFIAKNFELQIIAIFNI